MLDRILEFIPLYVLVLFRIAGLMIWAPMLGSVRIPRRIKAMIACVLAASIAPGLNVTVVIPQSPWILTVMIGCEIAFGAAMGLILTMIFVAAQWGGDLVGQQMGLNIGQTLNPQFSGGSSVVGDTYFYLALLIFLSLGGHRAMILAVAQSFQTLPLLAVSVDRPLVDMLTRLMESATLIALQLAAPMLITMMVVDLILGFVGKSVPQLNILSVGIGVRSLVGMVVLVVSISLTSRVLRLQMLESMHNLYAAYTH